MPYQDNKPMEVLIIFEEEIETDCAYLGDSEFEGISLTEEWLINFGFELIEKSSFSTGTENKYKVFVKEEFTYNALQEKFWYQGRIVMPEIKYVHQLQNLYFALTGKELIISQK